MSLFVYVKDHLPILDVISEFVQLKPAGHYWKGPCPFHAEKDASFTVSPDKQIFYCFGCHASGDVIGFMSKVENMTQMEAAQHLVDRYSINVPEKLLQGAQASTQSKDEKERYFRTCKAISEWAARYLASQKAASTYLAERNINSQSIKNFIMGYFPSGVAAINGFLKDMNQAGILLKDLLEYGFLGEGRATLFSPFEERIIFPIKDSMGRFCGFGGRIFQPGDQRPKYYNSKESDGFDKGKLLFGFDLAKKAMQDQGVGFLVEGYMDCIMMVQYGYHNTVATLGTACTLEHLKILSRQIHTLFVLYDGDLAGQKAMLRLTELCWEVNLDLKVIVLPPGHDPASFLTHVGPLDQLISQACDIITFFINSTGANFAQKPLAHKLAVAEKIASVIAKLSNQFKQDLLLHHAASIIQMPFSSLKELMLNTQARMPREKALPESIPAATENMETEDEAGTEEIFLLEEKIFSVILNNLKTPMEMWIPEDVQPYFSTTGQYLLQKLNLFIKNIKQEDEKNISINGFLELLDEKHKQWAMRISMQHGSQSCQLTMDHLLVRFYKFHWQKIVKDTREQVVQAKQEHNTQKVQDVLERFAQLKLGILQNRGLIR